MSDAFERERQRLISIAAQNPRPCRVCQSRDITGIGTWIPNEKFRLAAGGNSHATPVFAFWLCRIHSELTEENSKLIRQSVLRFVRTNSTYNV